MSAELITKTLDIYQSQKILISSRKNKISRLYCFSLRHLKRKKVNQSHILLAWASVSMWYISFFKICQILLLFIHRFSKFVVTLTFILKIISATGSIILVEVGNKNLEQIIKKISVENWDKKSQYKRIIKAKQNVKNGWIQKIDLSQKNRGLQS